MKPFFILSVGLCLNHLVSYAQFAPIVGQIGTTAMHKDSSAFIGWATSCQIVRGLQDISIPANGYANVGDSSLALGIAGGNGIVSLGDGGYAILQFSSPIVDGIGPDIAVFENSFDDSFLELAFVEVSSDGIHFFRFPAISNTDTTLQTGSFGLTDATKIHNLAGKYRGQYGTPFDLADIPNHNLLNKQTITHVKIIDVVGCIQNQYCTRDVNHHKVNDPWPTSFGSSGFDLDAVGVIHNQHAIGVEELRSENMSLFPNPAIEILHVFVGLEAYSVSILNALGEEIVRLNNQAEASHISIHEFKQGVYFLTIHKEDRKKTFKFIKS